METVLFTIGDWTVTTGLTLAGAGFVIALALITLVIVSLRGNRGQLEQAAHAATESLRASFVQQLAERDARIRELDARLENARKSNGEWQAKAAALEAQMQAQREQAEEARQQMTNQFRLIANDVLKSHGETFSKQNREQVDTLLKPLSEKISEFHKGLVQDRAAMGERIRKLSEDSMRMATEAHNLTRALKGSSQAQGAWGEMILDSILERSGLREGEQYITQKSHSAGEGARVRTDVEVLMPNGDSMVIDSKVSLTAFEALTNAGDEADRARFLRDHVASMRGHIKTLGAKDYHRHANSGFDFVLMFVPIEAAFSAAITADPNLIDHAIGQGVMITTPTTLLSALRTVRNVWDIEKRHQNAEEIAERAGILYDKVAGFAANMDKLGSNLDRAQKSFSDAKNQFIEGRGSVLRQVEMLRELGAKTSKQLPAGWQGDADGDSPNRLVLTPAPQEQEED